MNQNKKPSHFVYTVREGKERGSDFWTKIGVAFAHNDGKGFGMILDAVPLDGKLTIRIPDTILIIYNKSDKELREWLPLQNC